MHDKTIKKSHQISVSFRKKIPQIFAFANLKSLIWIVFRTMLLIGLGFMIFFPILTKISRALMTWQDINDITVYYIPRIPTVENFITAWKGLNYSKLILSAFLITTLVAVLQTLSCTLVSYGLARYKFIGKKIMFAVVILTLLIPPQFILLPMYLKFRFFNVSDIFIFGKVLSGTNLINTLWPFVLLSGTAMAFKSGLYIYLLRQFFSNMPLVLEEAAHIDGCSEIQTFFRIMLPNAIPMVITVFLFSFVWQWTDYNYSIMLANNLPTLPMSMIAFNTYLSTHQMVQSQVLVQGPMLLLLIGPLLILYVFTQRFFVESITRSGIVG